MRVDSIAADVQTLATKAGRVVGTRGHREARKYIEHRFRETGVQPLGADYAQYPGEIISNLIGVRPGNDPDATPIIVGGHYDAARSSPGADDNACSVAVMLAAAAEYQGGTRPIYFIAFDAEEPPYFMSDQMGSVVAARTLGAIHYAIVMDMLGHRKFCDDEPCNLLYVSGLDDSGHAEAVAGIEVNDLYIYPMHSRAVGDISDHAPFRRNHTPYIMLQCGNNPDIHSPADTSDKIDFQKLGLITEYVLGLIKTADAATSWWPNKRDDADVEPERRMIARLASRHPAFSMAQVRSRRELLEMSSELFFQY